jgi:hypothetical protein
LSEAEARRDTPILGETRETGWFVLVLAAFLYSTAILFVNAVLFRGSVGESLRAIHRATGGLVTPTLVGSLVVLLIVVGLAIFALGRIEPRDVGWTRAKLAPAALATLGAWGVVQIVSAVAVASGGGTLSLHPAWTYPGAGGVLGRVIGQAFGNALVEETVFRGFFFPQLVAKFQRKLGRASALGAAALVSQVGFALSHIPNRIFVKGIAGPELVADLARLTLLGSVFLAIYLVTRNLWVAVGLHALGNAPTPLVQVSGGVQVAAWLSSMLLVVGAWGVASRRRRSRSASDENAPGSEST